MTKDCEQCKARYSFMCCEEHEPDGSFANVCKHYSSKQQTNHERIRSMSVEELAVFFAKVNASLCKAELDVVAYDGKNVIDNIAWLNRIAYDA